MNYSIVAAAAMLLLEPCLNYDSSQAVHILGRIFYQDQFWQMPSEAPSGRVIFGTKHAARQQAVLVPIPVMQRLNQPPTGSTISCSDWQADKSRFFAFVLNRTKPVSIMQATSIASSGYIPSISNDQEDLAVKELYQAYLSHRATFFYCTEPVNRFAYLEQSQLYTWDTEINQFRVSTN